MLVNKNKENKKKIRKDTITSEDTIQSFRSWVRKIEQMTNSISCRLAAVEKRISGQKNGNSNNSILTDTMDGPIERIFAVLKEEKSSKNIGEVSRALDKEFTIMQEELIAVQNDISSLKEKIDGLDSYLSGFKEDLKNLKISDSKLLEDIDIRLEKIERREPLAMKIGKMEIPIEITGIIGGILAFIIAIIVIFGNKDIIVSPLFLTLVGFIFIGSALFKTFNIGLTVAKPLEKTDKIKVEDSS
jgi:chromosome segregation ATPase